MVAGSKRYEDQEEECSATKRQRLDSDSSQSGEDELEEILTTNTAPSLIEHDDITLPIDEEDGYVDHTATRIIPTFTL